MARLTWFACAVVMLGGGCGDRDATGLVRVDDEPNGLHCPEGGVAIHTGSDADGDGALGDAEITSTQYVCNGASKVVCRGGTIVEGTITVRDADGLDALAGVSCVDGDLLIAGTELGDLAALRDLVIVTGDVVIAGNPVLASLDGLASLREVGRTYLVQGNPGLTALDALGGLHHALQITIVGNDGLVDLRGLESFVELGAFLTIANNGALTSLAGLDNLTTAARNVAIRGNRNLTSLAALDRLRAVHLLEISGSPSLEHITLAGLEKVTSRLLITTNAGLTAIDLPVLTTIGDFVQIQGNAALVSMRAPNLLTAAHVLVTNDASLETLEVPSLVLTTGRIELIALPRLRTVDFGALASIADNLVLSGVTQLPNLHGFANLTTIGGSLLMSRADTLSGFAGFDQLTTVYGDLGISSNQRLSSFTGLAAFAEVGNDLTITSNPQLSTAVAQQFAERITVNGTTTIQ